MSPSPSQDPGQLQPRATGPLRRVRKHILRLLGLLCVWGLVHLAVVCIDGCTDEARAADVAVVLGNHVSNAGEPSRRLQLRLDRAHALWLAGLVPRIIVSGGQDPGSPHEAEVMKQYLVARGVPADRIVEDRGGINTHATARFVAGWLRARGERSAIAVSQYYHVTRTKLALRRFGVDATGAHADLELELREPWSLLREVVGFYAYLFKDYDHGGSDRAP
ncbi:YdcF family protein [Nannocystis sp. SCPEA4]|uniref:YdcF family protein n=1 Tax=Nannocystis sp. SCPEA4 TaxID=2996787 RepID=UPI00226FB5BC|nr:YdcF family protein [Nannocystis sp. SCPEA4]MCY1063121.1 YdcF family protein [Nannocystis sp. SCPEA4]